MKYIILIAVIGFLSYFIYELISKTDIEEARKIPIHTVFCMELDGLGNCTRYYTEDEWDAFRKLQSQRMKERMAMRDARRKHELEQEQLDEAFEAKWIEIPHPSYRMYVLNDACGALVSSKYRRFFGGGSGMAYMNNRNWDAMKRKFVNVEECDNE